MQVVCEDYSMVNSMVQTEKARPWERDGPQVWIELVGQSISRFYIFYERGGRLRNYRRH